MNLSSYSHVSLFEDMHMFSKNLLNRLMVLTSLLSPSTLESLEDPDSASSHE